MLKATALVMRASNVTFLPETAGRGNMYKGSFGGYDLSHHFRTDSSGSRGDSKHYSKFDHDGTPSKKTPVVTFKVSYWDPTLSDYRTVLSSEDEAEAVRRATGEFKNLRSVRVDRCVDGEPVAQIVLFQ